MSDFKVLWTGFNYLILFFGFILNNLYDSFLIKKKKFYFFFNIDYYFNLFNILSSNLIIKIDTIIDIVAVHYFSNKNEFEFLYVCLNYKLNLRFFLKLLINKEDLIVSINKLYQSVE
jgi:hypothetical protein